VDGFDDEGRQYVDAARDVGSAFSGHLSLQWSDFAHVKILCGVWRQNLKKGKESN
jgi:hypothetical protein